MLPIEDCVVCLNNQLDSYLDKEDQHQRFDDNHCLLLSAINPIRSILQIYIVCQLLIFIVLCVHYIDATYIVLVPCVLHKKKRTGI